MLWLFVIVILVFYLSIPGILAKQGYKMVWGLVPGFNLYLLGKVLNIHPLILIILLIGLFLPISRNFILTLIYIFTPFMICDAYNHGFGIGLLTLLFPFIVLPIIAYGSGGNQ